MFIQLIKRNSRRSRKENGLFFASLLISIIAFYIILALPHQDVMLFLTKMESDAVDRLLSLIPAFYGITLIVLFFLIFYAGRFQLERRRHEFGVCLMMGMRRTQLFAMLLAEDIQGSILALAVGLPSAVLLSELISLITAKFVGLGIIGHQFTFSMKAALWTIAGFLLIKLAAFLILSGRITRQQIGSLLVESPDGTKKQYPSFVYASALVIGLAGLAGAYRLAISGLSWYQLHLMALTLLLGFSGTVLFFFGLRFPAGIAASRAKKDQRLGVFNFRQLQETVIHRSGSLAVSSLLILAALCCFGAGTAITHFYGSSEDHLLDYTFEDHRALVPDDADPQDQPDPADQADTLADLVTGTLRRYGLYDKFSHLFEMKIGHINTSSYMENALQMDTLWTFISGLDQTNARDTLLNNLSYIDYPYLISLDSYNNLRAIAGAPALKLGADEAAVYMDHSTSQDCVLLMNQALETYPEVLIDNTSFHLTNTVQTVNLITDRSITLSFALILPDEAFAYFTQGDYNVYVNGVLNTAEKTTNLMQSIADMNEQLSETELSYESYLQNMGRQLFYVVAASYITIYLAVIFLIIANTFIGVQFLISQQKAHCRYQTLIHLGATYELLCRSIHKQVCWYFGIPAAVAALSSLFGVRALFSGLLTGYTPRRIHDMLLVSAVMILVLCIIECIYMTVVKRTSCRYLLTFMTPNREE